MTHEDSMLVVLPLNHVGGITCAILSSILAKAAGVLIPIPDPGDVVRQAAAYAPTVYGGVPTLYTILFMNPDFLKLDMSRVRLAICGGSNAEPALLTRIQEVFPNAKVMNLYGLSETSGAVVLSPLGERFRDDGALHRQADRRLQGQGGRPGGYGATDRRGRRALLFGRRRLPGLFQDARGDRRDLR